ncbi:heme exporter protein CcmD [Actibacterium sp. XHP0104]|uniref:heme exporter protein CcmD n=1 Tax=Actibacterium sp. XHP0104 TaxID=2984335 RepID=UPI0039925F39
MPDLGKYAGAVLGSYAVSLGLLAGLIILTLWRGARIKRQLAAMENRRGDDGQA